MRRGSSLWVALVLLAPAGLADFGDPQVVILDWREGQFVAGTLGAVQGTIGQTWWPIWVDQCHRKLRADLLYEPKSVAVGGNPAQVEVPYDFKLTMSVGPWSQTLWTTHPGFDQAIGTAPAYGSGIATLQLQKGVLVDWSLRIRGWEVVDEPACVPVLLVNEVEANPAGTDAGAEWVELYNPGTYDIDAGGWTLESTHGIVERLELPPSAIVPRSGRLVIGFPDQFLDNDNESVVLADPLGAVVDTTPVASDADNDGRTWQRVPDGAPNWSFRDGTPGAANPAS